MSATHDKSQRITFIYSNMYKVYKSGQEHDLIEPFVVLREQDQAAKLDANLKQLQTLGERLNNLLKGLKNKLK